MRSVSLEDNDDIYEKVNADSWFVSYSDVVTLLLCFFIIFYSIEKNVSKNKEKVENAKSNVESLATTDIKDLFLKDKLLSQYISTSDFSHSKIVLNFKNKSFFEKGKYQVNNIGIKILAAVATKLSALPKDSLFEVAGHSDTTPVKQLKSRWWKTNMELSLLRALSVYKFIELKGINKERLSVKGYGAHSIVTKTEKTLATQRRISLAIYQGQEQKD